MSIIPAYLSVKDSTLPERFKGDDLRSSADARGFESHRYYFFLINN